MCKITTSARDDVGGQRDTRVCCRSLKFEARARFDRSGYLRKKVRYRSGQLTLLALREKKTTTRFQFIHTHTFLLHIYTFFKEIVSIFRRDTPVIKIRK